MQREILELIDEQYNEEKLIKELCESKTDDEILSVARKIIVLRESADWLKSKVQMLYESEKSIDGGIGENGPKTEM